MSAPLWIRRRRHRQVRRELASIAKRRAGLEAIAELEMSFPPNYRPTLNTEILLRRLVRVERNLRRLLDAGSTR